MSGVYILLDLLIVFEVGMNSRKSDESHVCSKIRAKVMEVTSVAKVIKITFVTKFATPYHYYFWVLIKGAFIFAFVSLLFPLSPDFISR